MAIGAPTGRPVSGSRSVRSLPGRSPKRVVPVVLFVVMSVVVPATVTAVASTVVAVSASAGVVVAASAGVVVVVASTRPV